MAEDSNYSSVVMLLDGESLLDYKLHTMTAHGNCVVSSAQAKFGTQSIAFDGTGDYLDTPDSADWDFGSGDFTIEFHAYLASTSTIYALIGQWGSAGQRNFVVFHEAGNVQFSFTTDGSSSNNAVLTASGCSATTWHHFAFSRNGADFRAFVDGVQKGSTYNIASSTLFNSNSTLELGANASGTYAPMNGYLDNVRITKGVGRYTANFTPPTAAFPTTGFEEFPTDTVGLVDNANNINILYKGLGGFSLSETVSADVAYLLALYVAGSSESATAQETVTHEVIQWFFEAVSANETADARATTTLSYVEQIAATETLIALFNQLVSDSASGAETWYLVAASLIAEVATVADITSSQIVAIQALSEVIVAIELQQSGLLGTVSESAALVTTVSNLVQATQAVLEQAAASATQTSYLYLYNTVTDSVQASETVTLWQSLTNTIEEGVSAFVHLNIGGEIYTGWVLNTKNLATTEYQGMQFNSLARLGNRYFGASANGIYEMTGTQDAGAGISTYIQSGLMDFGSEQQKGMNTAYLAVDADDRIALGVSVSEKSGISKYWYEISPTMAAMNNINIPIGRGLRGRYWKLDVASESMSSFDAITLLPVILTRKI